jgi:hypothetical protein
MRQQLVSQASRDGQKAQLDAPAVVAKDMLLNILQKRSAALSGTSGGGDGQAADSCWPPSCPTPGATETAALLARDSLVWHMRCIHNSTASNADSSNKQEAAQLLATVVAAAQREWKALMSVRLETFKVFAGSMQEREVGPPPASGNNAVPAATVDDLILVLCDRMNATAHNSRKSVPFAPAIDNFGVLSMFNSAVHAVVAASQTGSPRTHCAPSVATLRGLFQELNPTLCSRQVFTHASLNSTAASEEFFAAFVRYADSPDEICMLAAARGIPPGMRRLFYAKLLHLPVGAAAASGGPSLPLGRNISFASPFSQQRVTCPASPGYNYGGAWPGSFCSSAWSFCSSASPAGSPVPFVVQNSVDPTVRALASLMQTDVNTYVGDSDKYFVFVDEVTTVFLALLHDPTVSQLRLRHALRLLQRDTAKELSAFHTVGDATKMLGAVPLTTASLCIAPLCFATGDVEELYELASAMYGQLWMRIHAPSIDLFSMCLTFEGLASHFAPHAVLHCFTKLGFSPLSIALPWMVTGFAKLLEPQETLLLWDLLLAYHCMETSSTRPGASPYFLLAALAAAVFSFRSQLVLACSTKEQVEQVFEDGLKLRPIPLLQQLLFIS